MRSAFFELNIGAHGLFAAQRGLSVTSNNIANVNTQGYSRQVLTQQASRALRGSGTGMIGTGVTTTGIERIRNSYLDMKIWNQKPTLGEYRVKSEQSSLIEGVFGEPSDVGFTTIFNNVFTGFDNVSKIPDEGERKVALMQNLKSFTQYFNNTSDSLQKYQRDLNFEVKNKVDEINIIARRIESLNKQIYQAEIHAGTANSLRDERELQIDRLSELVNVQTNEYEVPSPTGKPEKRYSVKVNGQTLVDHFTSRELDIKVREDKNNPGDAEGLYDVIWKDGLNFKMNDPNLSGELKGAIDMRDGNSNLAEPPSTAFSYRGIPYYMQRLDTFVKTFADKVNNIYKQGVDADGNDGDILFEFIGKDGLPGEHTAANFKINQDILDNPGKIKTTKDKENAPGGNDLMLDLMKLKHDREMFNEGEPNDYMVSIFSELGINAKEANMYSASQENMVNAIENQRLSISQVAQNEEMISLVKYQQAYQAAARIISTMDSIYDITINRLGAY